MAEAGNQAAGRSKGAAAEVEAVVDGFFGAMNRQHYGWMSRHLARDPGMVNIGTESDEYWIGWEIMDEATQDQFQSLKSYKAALRNRVTRVRPSADVAWFSHVMDARIDSANDTTYLKNARFTGVLEKREGRWVIVQTHVSIPEYG